MSRRSDLEDHGVGFQRPLATGGIRISQDALYEVLSPAETDIYGYFVARRKEVGDSVDI